MAIHPPNPGRATQNSHPQSGAPEPHWHRFSSSARKLSFRYPDGWGIARRGSYLFLCNDSQGSLSQLVLDLTPIHLYPYKDISEYLDTMGSGPDVEVESLPGGYLSGRVHKPALSRKEFNLFYIGKGNMAYSLTADSPEILETADKIIHSIRFE